MDLHFAWQAWHFWDIHLTFTWQAWHLVTWIVTLHGRHGAYGTGLAPVARLGRSGRGGRRGFLRGRRGTFETSTLLSRGRRCTWWHGWIVTLRGRPGTYGIGLAPVARLGQSGRGGRRGFLRGRRSTWWHGLALGVAGVALGDMDGHFAWQAWHLWHWAGSGGALGPVALGWLRWRAWAGVDGVDAVAFCVAGLALLRHPPYFHVAGVALKALGWLRWRAWAGVDAVDAAAFCVAGVPLGDMDLHLAWQAWHLVTWMVTLRGRHGTYGAGLALVARLGRWHWAGSGGALGPGLALVARLGRSGRGGRRGFLRGRRGTFETSTLLSRGRRGTWWHGSSLCVAGVALMALGWLRWRAWAGVDGVDAAAFCVAGVTLGDIHTYMHACMHAYIHTCIHTYMHACMHAYIHTYIYTYIYIHIYTYIHILYIYIHTDRQTYIHTWELFKITSSATGPIAGQSRPNRRPSNPNRGTILIDVALYASFTWNLTWRDCDKDMVTRRPLLKLGMSPIAVQSRSNRAPIADSVVCVRVLFYIYRLFEFKT